MPGLAFAHHQIAGVAADQRRSWMPTMCRPTFARLSAGEGLRLSGASGWVIALSRLTVWALRRLDLVDEHYADQQFTADRRNTADESATRFFRAVGSLARLPADRSYHLGRKADWKHHCGDSLAVRSCRFRCEECSGGDRGARRASDGEHQPSFHFRDLAK